MDACKEEVEFKFLYPLEMPLRQRVEKIAKKVYGADGVSGPLKPKPRRKSLRPILQKDFYTMMVKTHLSLSHDPTLKAYPKDGVCRSGMSSSSPAPSSSAL